MKKFIYFVPLLAMPLLLINCGSDDDEPGGPVNTDKITSPSIIKSNDGTQVLATKIGDIRISYNDKGLPTKVDDYVIDYDKGEIIDEYYLEYGETVPSIKFSMNSNGYITEMGYNKNRKDSYGDQETENVTVNYSYNGNGLLTKVTFKGYEEWSGTEYGESYYEKEEWSGTITFTWNGEKLKGAVYKSSWKETEKGYEGTDIDTGEEETTYSVRSDIDNPLRQCSLSYGYMIDADICDDLALAGLFGKAPANLPTQIYTIEKESGDDEYYDYEDEYYEYYKYSFNDDGTISNEQSAYSSSQATPNYWSDNYYSYTNMLSRTSSPYDFGEALKGKTGIRRHHHGRLVR